MKSKSRLTLKQIIDWANKNNISLDTPVACYLGEYERGFDAHGIVYETKSPVDNDGYVDECKCNELVGEHCYCKNTEFDHNIIVITDGCHYYDENK